MYYNSFTIYAQALEAECINLESDLQEVRCVYNQWMGVPDGGKGEVAENNALKMIDAAVLRHKRLLEKLTSHKEALGSEMLE